MGCMIELTAADGHGFAAYTAGPPDAPRGVVHCPDLGGVNKYTRRLCDQMAAYGFRVISPSLFDRVERSVELTSRPDDMKRGAELAAAITSEQIAADVEAAAAHLGDAKVGAVGFCFGGTAAWLAAARSDRIGAAVCYYGGGIAAARQDTPRCPTRLHFGEWDRTIPLPDIEAIRRAQPQVEVEIYHGAAHHFACEARETFNPGAAEDARDHMLSYLRKHLANTAAAGPTKAYAHR